MHIFLLHIPLLEGSMYKGTMETLKKRRDKHCFQFVIVEPSPNVVGYTYVRAAVDCRERNFPSLQDCSDCSL